MGGLGMIIVIIVIDYREVVPGAVILLEAAVQRLAASMLRVARAAVSVFELCVPLPRRLNLLSLCI